MVDEIRDQPLDELEVSVKTAAFLGSLGLSTVGELVDLPEISAPRLVLRELQEVVEDLGLELKGVLVPSGGSPRKPVKATGSVAKRWQAIRKYLEGQHPALLEGFRAPAAPDAIAAAEKALGQVLPEDYRQFLAIHNGQHPNQPMVQFGTLIPVEEIVATRAQLHGKETAIDVEMAGEGVRPVELSPGWIPISRSPRGREFLCLDLDPGPGGKRGQVLEFIADDDGRPLVARSFADLLSLYLAQLQTGEIELDE